MGNIYFDTLVMVFLARKYHSVQIRPNILNIFLPFNRALCPKEINIVLKLAMTSPLDGVKFVTAVFRKSR